MQQYKSLGELIKNQSKLYGDKPFLFWKNAELSYSRLTNIINQVANNYIQMGLQKGDRVAILLPNCPEFIFNFLGAAKAGTVVVATDPNSSTEEILEVLKLSDAKLLVCGFDQMLMAMKLKAQCPVLENAIFTDCNHAADYSQIYQSVENYQKPAITHEDLLAEFYIKDQNGEYRVHQLSHLQYLEAACSFAEKIDLNSEDKLLCFIPLHLAQIQVFQLIASLIKGASVVLENNLSKNEFIQKLENAETTSMLLNKEGGEILNKSLDPERMDLKSLKSIVQLDERIRMEISNVKLFSIDQLAEDSAIKSITDIPQDLKSSSFLSNGSEVNMT